MNSLSRVRRIGYTILHSPYNYLRRELAVLGFEGLFVKLEEYLPKWAITSALWMGFLILSFQSIQATIEFFSWIVDPLAEKGLLGAKYTETWRLITGVLNIISLVVLVIVSSIFLRNRPRVKKTLERAENQVQRAERIMAEIRVWFDELEKIDPKASQALRDRIKEKI